jgi:cytoskeletal protein CcmA (bactofilin family)
MAFGKSKDEVSMDKIPPIGTSTTTLGSGEKVEAFLGKGSKVVGSLTFTGPVELDGYVEGEVLAQDRLTVGESAVVHAKITGAEVVVKGTVNGDIYASRRLALKKPARVVGNISTTCLSIEEGVTFEGKSSMDGAPKVDGKNVGQKPPLQDKGLQDKGYGAP